MAHTLPSAEATLVFAAAPLLDEAELAHGLAACIRRRRGGAERVEIDHSPGRYLHFGAGEVEVLVSLCPNRLPADRFAGARRPRNRLRADGRLQSLLAFHETCIVVLVRARGCGRAPVPAARIEALCETICHRLAAAAAPDLIHLASNDTLYAADEFARRDPALRPVAATCGPAQPAGQAERRDAHIRAAPQIPRRAADWFERGGDLKASTTEAAGPSTELGDTPAGSAAIYVMNVTLILLAFPVGYALLIYNLMSGGSFVATARAISLTGIATAATSSGLASRALELL